MSKASRKPGAESAGPRRLLSLPRLEETSGALRSTFVNIGFFAAMLLLIPAVAGQFTRSGVVIAPISTPKALVRLGLTPDVVANRLWDGLQDFAQTASAARASIVAIPDSQLIEFSLPDAGFSLDSIFTQIKQFFGIYETRIEGEIVCATADCAPAGLTLRLRVVRTSEAVVDLPPMGDQREADYFRAAAAGVYAVIDPYVAIAAQAGTEPLKAAALARGLALKGDADAKWAHNLLGDIERQRGAPLDAIEDYRAALAIDPAFETARSGLALALLAAGRPDEALATIDEIEAANPTSVLAATTRAAVHEARGDLTGSREQWLLAAEREPGRPRHFAEAARIELALGETDAAFAHLDQALAVDPGYGPALVRKATELLRIGKADDAAAVYRRLLDVDPARADAHVAIARIQLQQADYAGALRSFEAALALDPADPAARLGRAEVLMDLRRDGEAIAALEVLAAAARPDPTVLLDLGQLYARVGRRADAEAAFARFLDLAPPDDPRRAAANAGLQAAASR